MSSALHFTVLSGGWGLLRFDTPDRRVNTFTAEVIDELAMRLDEIDAHRNLRGLIVTSGKPEQFIAGADLHDLELGDSAAQQRWTEAILRGNRLMTRLSDLPMPTVTLINGPCLGGGTELALSTDFRVALDSAKVKIGLPEVKLGLIPGWGGTQRLPRLIPLEFALPIITSGEAVDSKTAIRIGLVDQIVSAEDLLATGIWLLESSAQADDWRSPRQKRRGPVKVSQDDATAVFSSVQLQVSENFAGDSPARFTAWQVVKNGLHCDLTAALEIEQQAFLQLIGSPASTRLIAEFFSAGRSRRNGA